MRTWIIAIASLCLLATPLSARAEAPAIDWEVPARLGQDADGDDLIDYPDSAEEVATGPFDADLRVREDLCQPGSVYRWSVDGEEAEAGRDLCELRWGFSEEGAFEVGVEIEFAATGDVHSYEQEVVIQDWLVVSLGDSVGSGEGNPDRPGLLRRARWQSPRCHRSTLAAPAQAALALERADPRTSVTLVHLACSGAKLKAGLLEPYAGVDVPEDARPPLLDPQIGELAAIKSRRPIDAVVINIGANDLFFAPLAGFCVREVDCISKQFAPERPLDGSAPPDLPPDLIHKALAKLRIGYEDLGEELKGIVEPDRVFVVDYFDPTRDGKGVTCRKIGVPLVPRYYIDRQEAEFAASGLLAPLNVVIGDAAAREGWIEVTGVTEAFREHGYCAGKQSWIRTLTKSLVTQAGSHLSSRWVGALHPNAEGHQATAGLISAALSRRLYAGEGATARPEPSQEEPSEAGDGGPEGDELAGLEEDVRNALLLFVALCGSSALFLWRRLRRKAPAAVAADEDPPKIRSDNPRFTHDDGTIEAFGAMLQLSGHWVHRRVEAIEFIDEGRMRRRVSIDFTPLKKGRQILAPVAMVSKGVLTRFDLRDEDGSSVPMRTADQNAALSTEYMLAVAKEVTKAPPSERLKQLCWTIARGELAEAELAVAEIKERVKARLEPPTLLHSRRFMRLTTTFSKRFPIVVALRDTERRVLKYAADWPVERAPGWKARLGLSPARFEIEVPELGDAGSRHLEFLPGDGFEIHQAAMGGIEPDGELRATSAVARDGHVAHLVLSNVEQPTRGKAEVRLWAERRGIFFGGPLLAIFAAIALTAAWFALPELAEDSRDAASLLLAVPAAFVTYIGARSPHPLAAALMKGVRALVTLAGAAAFIAGGAMALGYSAETLRLLLGGAAIVTWLTVVGLAAIYFAPEVPLKKERPIDA